MNIKDAAISIALTFFLGPGAGHIYLKKYKKGLALLGFTFITGAIFFFETVKTALKLPIAEQNPARLLHDFYIAHPTAVLYYDIIFAAIWAYAFVDVFFLSQTEDLKKPDDGENTE